VTDLDLPYGDSTVRVRFPPGVSVTVVRTGAEASRGPAEGRAPGGAAAGEPSLEEAGVVERALDAPMNAAPLADAARGKRRVVIVVPDRTRPARTRACLGPVLRRLDAAGVTRRDVCVLVGGGIHEPTTPEEMRGIVGEEVARTLTVVSTAADDAGAHVDLAPDAAVTPCRVHRRAGEADLLLLTGAVAPHYLAGFSGGPKALVPGCADRETVLAAHRLTLDATVAPDGSVRSWLGRIEGNPFRDALLRIARRHGRTWALAVDVAGGRVVSAVAGEVGDAHAEAARRHRAAAAVPRPPLADLVVAGGGAPRDRDLVQAHKALVTAAECAKPGAPIVWLAHAGAGPGPPAFLQWFEAGRPARHLAALRRAFHPYGLTAYALRWKAARHPVHVVSTLSRDLLRPMGLLPFEDAQAALDHALAGTRVDTCVVLPRAAETLFDDPPEGSSPAGQA
jgi:nickel-dependent lactate racemase